MAGVVKRLQHSTGLPETECFERMLAVHHNQKFLVTFGEEREVDDIYERMILQAQKQGITLRFSKAGPFPESLREQWATDLKTSVENLWWPKLIAFAMVGGLRLVGVAVVALIKEFSRWINTSGSFGALPNRVFNTRRQKEAIARLIPGQRWLNPAQT